MDQLQAGIRQEYAKNYLWTGDINEDLYEVSTQPAPSVAACSSSSESQRSALLVWVSWPIQPLPALFRPASTLKEDCSFTDPTLSFAGLSTYKRNVGSLQGVLDRLVSNSRSVLYSCELQQVKHNLRLKSSLTKSKSPSRFFPTKSHSRMFSQLPTRESFPSQLSAFLCADFFWH